MWLWSAKREFDSLLPPLTKGDEMNNLKVTRTDLVKGFKDYTGEEALKRAEIKKILVETFEKYGFEPAETPIIENEEFVKGENKADEAVSDIYKLKDKGKRKLALRYEFTFQLKRIADNKKLPYKRYEIGPVFRDEPASANRFRQFIQCDADIIGSSVKDEAEILALVKDVFDKLGLEFKILVGNRKLINEILEKEGISKKKEEVMRVIDKLQCACKYRKEDVEKELKSLSAEKLIEIFKKPENYFKKYESYSEFEELKSLCSYYGIKVEFSPTLVRGLSYYKGNVFEIKGKGSKDTICAGGTYEISGKRATGISFGLDRISQLAKIKLDKEKYLVISLNQDKEAIKIAKKLRSKGKNVSLFYGKPSKALGYANSYDYNRVIFVGEKEVKVKRFKVKDMKSGKESILKNA